MPKGTDLTTIEQILQAITDSGSGAQEWLNSLHDEQYNEVMEILAVDIDFEGAIEKEEGRWALRNVEEHIGTIENFKIDVLDDGEERQIPVKVYDDETYTSSHRETFWIQKEGEFYYLIIDGQKGQKVGIKGEARALSKIFSVCEFLDKKCKEVERTEELTLQEAIEKGDFNRIIQIIKQDDELSDEMIIQLMRLSKIDGKGKAVTFLQAMLGHDGIYDSTRAEYILNRGKELLSDFECKALFQLCDDNLSAQQLLFCKGREHLVKYSPVRTTTTVILKGVDTHSETIHASVDISATRLFRRFAERYPELELSPRVFHKLCQSKNHAVSLSWKC